MSPPAGHLAAMEAAGRPESSATDPHLVLVTEARYWAQRQPAGLIAALRRRGVSVAVIDPEFLAAVGSSSGCPERFDVVVARGRSASLLSALRRAEGFGLPTFNASRAVEAVLDKSAMAKALVAGGVPTPPTWVGPPATLASTVPAAAYPLIVKPVFGDNSRGIRTVKQPDELAALAWPEPVALAQPFLATDGTDLKLYGVGERVWAVRAPSPLRGEAGPTGQPAHVTSELAELGRTCGGLFGLALWGVDCLTTPDGPVVVDVNDFPNYRGVPEADEALADHVLAVGRRA